MNKEDINENIKRDLQQAQKVYQALIVFADFLGKTENEIASNVAFLDKEKFQKIKKAVNLVNNFNAKSVKEKAEIMGYSYKENKNGSYEISGVL